MAPYINQIGKLKKVKEKAFKLEKNIENVPKSINEYALVVANTKIAEVRQGTVGKNSTPQTNNENRYDKF